MAAISWLSASSGIFVRAFTANWSTVPKYLINLDHLLGPIHRPQNPPRFTPRGGSTPPPGTTNNPWPIFSIGRCSSYAGVPKPACYSRAVYVITSLHEIVGVDRNRQ